MYTYCFYGSLLCALLAVFLIWREPRRVLYGFAMEAALVLLLIGAERYAVANELSVEPLVWIYIAQYALDIVIGAALIWDCSTLIRREGVSKANFLPLVFGIAGIAAGVLGYRDMVVLMAGTETYVFLMTTLLYLVTFTPLALGGFLLSAWLYHLLPKSAEVDYLIVLGCKIRADGTPTPLLRGRLDKAAGFWHKGGGRAALIVSGGQGSDEVVSEAQAMKSYLLTRGVPQDKIIMEEQSRNTRENLAFSMRLMREKSSAVICTSSYHVLRAVTMARALKLNAQGIGGKTAAYYLPVAFFREYIAVIYQNKLVILLYVLVAAAAAWPW